MKKQPSDEKLSQIQEAWNSLDVLFDGDRKTVGRRLGQVSLSDGHFYIDKSQKTRMHRWLKRPVEETIVTERVPKYQHEPHEDIFNVLNTVATRSGQLVVADLTYTPVNWLDGSTTDQKRARAVFITQSYEDYNTGGKIIEGLQFDFSSYGNGDMYFDASSYSDAGYHDDNDRTKQHIDRYLASNNLPSLGERPQEKSIPNEAVILKHCVKVATSA